MHLSSVGRKVSHQGVACASFQGQALAVCPQISSSHSDNQESPPSATIYKMENGLNNAASVIPLALNLFH